MSLTTAEKVVQSTFSRMKKYADSLQHGLAAPPQALTITKDLKDIWTKIDKMKQFASHSIDEVRKAGEHQIAAIKESTGSIFLEQNSAYHNRIEAIKDTCAAALDGQKILLHEGMEEFKKERKSHPYKFSW